jgi:hypothetical protein
MAAVAGALFAVKRRGRTAGASSQARSFASLAALGGEVRLIASRTVFAAWPMAAPIAA